MHQIRIYIPKPTLIVVDLHVLALVSGRAVLLLCLRVCGREHLGAEAGLAGRRALAETPARGWSRAEVGRCRSRGRRSDWRGCWGSSLCPRGLARRLGLLDHDLGLLLHARERRGVEVGAPRANPLCVVSWTLWTLTHASAPTRTCCQRDHCDGSTRRTRARTCCSRPGLRVSYGYHI